SADGYDVDQEADMHPSSQDVASPTVVGESQARPTEEPVQDMIKELGHAATLSRRPKSAHPTPLAAGSCQRTPATPGRPGGPGKIVKYGTKWHGWASTLRRKKITLFPPPTRM